MVNIFIYNIDMDINPNHQNLQVNLRSDDPEVQGNDDGDADLTFNFSRTVIIPKNYILNISTNEVEIPHSYYTFDLLMKFEVYYGLYSTPLKTYKVEIDIPLRFYSACGFVKYINAEFLAGSITAGYPKPPIFSFDCNTLKFKGVPSASYPWDWQATMRGSTGTDDLTESETNQVSRFLGMPYELPVGIGDVRIQAGVSDIWISTNVVDTSRHHNIYLNLGTDMTTGSIDSLKYSGENILSKIPVNAPFGSIITYRGSTLDGFAHRGQSINRIQCSLRDHSGKLLELNGTRFNISLLLQFIKKNPDPLPVKPKVNKFQSYKRKLIPKREFSKTTNLAKTILPKIKKLLLGGPTTQP